MSTVNDLTNSVSFLKRIISALLSYIAVLQKTNPVDPADPNFDTAVADIDAGNQILKAVLDQAGISIDGGVVVDPFTDPVDPVIVIDESTGMPTTAASVRRQTAKNRSAPWESQSTETHQGGN